MCVLLTAVIHFKLKASDTFVASEVIHYNDEQAEKKGKTPTGDKLDVNEIKSSAVLSKVVERMGLTGTYSVDNLISELTSHRCRIRTRLRRKKPSLKTARSMFTSRAHILCRLPQQAGRGRFCKSNS